MAAAPDTERGLAPSVLNLAFDLGTTLDVISGVRLGPGQISVAPGQARRWPGHGFGGSAAVFAAAGARRTALEGGGGAVPVGHQTVRREPAAERLRFPGLVLATPDDATSLRTDALEMAAAWDGAVLRVVNKARAGRTWPRNAASPGCSACPAPAAPPRSRCGRCSPGSCCST